MFYYSPGEGMRIVTIVFMLLFSLIIIVNFGGGSLGIETREDADLVFVGSIEISGGSGEKAIEGDVLTIIVRLINTGDIPAENVDVQLLIDGVEKKTSTLRSVKNDTDDVKTVIFSWVAEAGDHLLEVEIDPENSLIETNDQFTGENNNLISKEITIGSMNSLKKRIDSPDDYLILSFAALSILVVLKIFIIRNEKR
jgi:subtilase family serine protease